MSMEKKRKPTVWGMIFAYLAVSKIFYWFNFIIDAVSEGDLRTVGNAVLTRFISQDMLIILGILLVFCIEKFVQMKMSKRNKTLTQIVEHIIVFVLLMGVLITFLWARNQFLGFDSDFDWGGSLIFGGIAYLVITVVFEVKKYLKKKEMAEYISVLGTDEKLAILETLRDNGVFTQDEYDRKKEKI